MVCDFGIVNSLRGTVDVFGKHVPREMMPPNIKLHDANFGKCALGYDAAQFQTPGMPSEIMLPNAKLPGCQT